MRHRSIVLGGLALAVLLPGFVACAKEMSQPAARVPVDKLAGTWRGFGMVGEKNGPIEIKITNDGSFTGTAGGAIVSGKLRVGEGEITFDSIGPKQGSTGVLTYRESGGKAILRGSGEGKYAGTPLNFEITRVE
jgi:hypothetical protein